MNHPILNGVEGPLTNWICSKSSDLFSKDAVSSTHESWLAHTSSVLLAHYTLRNVLSTICKASHVAEHDFAVLAGQTCDLQCQMVASVGDISPAGDHLACATSQSLPAFLVYLVPVRYLLYKIALHVSLNSQVKCSNCSCSMTMLAKTPWKPHEGAQMLYFSCRQSNPYRKAIESQSCMLTDFTLKGQSTSKKSTQLMIFYPCPLGIPLPLLLTA